MLIFDQLKKNDPQLRMLAAMIFTGLAVLAMGLWWVQVVKAREYRNSLESQAYRTVRVPAVRGKILDRNGQVLAENRSTYNLNLYLEDMRSGFSNEYVRLRPRNFITNAAPFWKRWLGLGTQQLQAVRLKPEEKEALELQARFSAASNAVKQLSAMLQQSISLDARQFQKHYKTQRAMPYTVLKNLNSTNIARFQEQFSGNLAADLENQSTRGYPNGSVAAHLLGYVAREQNDDDDSTFDYALQDYRGVVGIEGYFNEELSGRPGIKSIQINNLGYRQSDTVGLPSEPGHNVVLTLDLDLQKAAETALTRPYGRDVKGVVVMLDAQSGDIIVMVSSPTVDPNYFVQGFPSTNELARWRDNDLKAQINRATRLDYAPGSIIKPIMGFAALDNKSNPLDETKTYYVEPNPTDLAKGCIWVGARKIRDTVPPGDYDFKNALIHSSNAYFVTNGILAGIENIVELGKRLHFGEPVDLPIMQETSGYFPSLAEVTGRTWRMGNTANMCIGQAPILVTPMQIAVMTAAIANGGTVYWPRLVDRVESQDPIMGEQPRRFEAKRVRDHLGVSARAMNIVHNAMLADTDEVGGTAHDAFYERDKKTPRLKFLKVGGKTGTAQVEDDRGNLKGYTLWFSSFAPWDNPRYALIVMVEGPGSGGSVCAPIACEIYQALEKKILAAQKTVVQSN